MSWKVYNTKKQSYSKDPSVSKSKSNFMSKISVSGTKKLSIASFDEGHNIQVKKFQAKKTYKKLSIESIDSKYKPM